jgi:predicted RND superfamily exporter protein
MEHFVRRLIALRWWLLGLAALLAALAFEASRRVTFDRSIERMFAPGDPLLAPYERLKNKFGGNEIVLAVYGDDDLLAADGRGIRRLAETSQRLDDVEGVRDVLSLAQLDALLAQLEKPKEAFGLLNLFGEATPAWHGPAILNPKSPLAARFLELFAGYTHSDDGRTAAVVCMLEPRGQTPTVSRAQTLGELRAIIRQQPDGVLAGEPVMIAEGFELLEADGRRLGTWSLWLLGLTILLCFRSLRWLIVPIVLVQWTLLVTRATLVASGMQLSMVSSMLAAIVTVVGIATLMHLVVHFRDERSRGVPSRDALLRAGTLLAAPILGAILTDVAGFGALWAASVEPVRDFGTMMVVGSLAVLPAIALLVPALALVGVRDRGPTRPPWGEERLGALLVRSVEWIRWRPRLLAAIAVAISLVASLGALRLEIETDFTRNFRRGSSVAKAYDFVESRLGGAGVWDVVVPAPPQLDQAYLAKVRRLQEQLRALTTGDPATGRDVPALTKVISLVDALDAVEADPLVARLTPQPEMRATAMHGLMPTFIAALRSTELDQQGQGRLRIMLRSRERQPAAEKQQLIQEVTRLAVAEFPPGETSSGAEVTGFFVLLTNLIQSILRDQWTTLAVACGAIALLVGVGFRSWKYALIALIPNAVPVFIVMGLLGWLGLKMNMGAVMIAAVSMGMSVDNSIHYFAAFRRVRRAGHTVHQALLTCQQSVGSAMIYATLALIVGFGVLITSEFVPTIYFGALMSLAMLGGMLGNLIILPLLLSWIEEEELPKRVTVEDAVSADAGTLIRP